MDKINFFYPRWGAEHIEWDVFLDRVQHEGYVGIEWFPFGEYLNYRFEDILTKLSDRKLQYTIVMAVQASFVTFEEYLLLLEDDLIRLTNLGPLKPLFISAQIGREYFNLDQICQCIELCNKIEASSGVLILQETHRNKWTYGLHKIQPILEIFPQLKFTLDISHWYCVSESLLEDQQPLLMKVLDNVFHIHARIGYTEGAQVHDVSSPIYQNIIEEHLRVWQHYLNIKKKCGFSSLTFTTEFGPPPYLISSGNKEIDYQEQWRQNIWMKNYLEQKLNYE